MEGKTRSNITEWGWMLRHQNPQLTATKCCGSGNAKKLSSLWFWGNKKNTTATESNGQMFFGLKVNYNIT